MSRLIDETLAAALDGVRLDRAVALAAEVSRSFAATLVKSGQVRLDGTVVTAGARRCAAGERLVVEMADDSRLAAESVLQADDAVAFTTVYADEEVVVIDKPAGLVVHPGSGHQNGTLANGLLARFPEMADVGERSRPGIVHRLDRFTSGLLMLARTARSYRSLTNQLRLREPKRLYSALVWGHPTADTGVIEAPVGRSNRNPTRMAVTARGRPAVTHYQVDARFHQPEALALLSCRLETGRTHQIRVHLQAIGHPVVGDTLYGRGRSHGTTRSKETSHQTGRPVEPLLAASRSGHPASSRTALDLQRPFLHAKSLTFRHPVNEDIILSFESELPDDLAAVIASCRSEF